MIGILVYKSSNKLPCNLCSQYQCLMPCLEVHHLKPPRLLGRHSDSYSRFLLIGVWYAILKPCSVDMPPCFMISFWLAIGQNKHPIRCQPLSYSSQCSTLTTSLRKYQTSSLVQSMIGFITILSLPLTHCTPSTSWLRVNWSNCSKLPLNRSVFFALIISASFLRLRCTDSSRLTPVSVTVPAPFGFFQYGTTKAH